MQLTRSGRFSRKDFAAGVVFLTFGAVGIFYGRHYPMGTAARMGAGYFPMVLSGILLLLGGGILARSFWMQEDRISRIALRPLLFVLGAVASFAVLIDSAGLTLSSGILIVLSSLGGCGFRVREILALMILLTGLSVLVFVVGLGLPISIWIP
jgi:hypothetical protein